MKTVLRWVVACFALSALVACNTMAGLGKDVERAGEKVQDAAKRKQ